MEKAAPTQPLKRKKSQPNPVSKLIGLLTVVFFILLCLTLVVIAAAIFQIPAQVARDFGPPSPALTLQQRVLYGYRLLANKENLLTPLDPQGRSREFEVGLGESVSEVAYHLEENLLIANAEAFRTFLVYAGLDTGVQAGQYQLSPAMNAVEIAHTLQDAVPGAVVFNILPGWRAEEIADALPTSGLAITPEAFMALVNDPPVSLHPSGVETLSSLEGFLAQGSYSLEREATAEQVLTAFVNRFDESLSPDLLQAFSNQDLDLVQAVTLASIVQREAVLEAEQPLIASVFYNRLANGMRLESDPTVQYALGYIAGQQTWWKNPLSLDDLQYDSVYNTYVYAGLPPGPISNPGQSALRAVGYPAETGYFFFRAQCDGSGRHSFAVTFDEHLNNDCR